MEDIEENKVIISMAEYERLKAVEKEFNESEYNFLKKEIEKKQASLKYCAQERDKYRERVNGLMASREILIEEFNHTKKELSIATDDLKRTNDMLQHEQEINSKIKSKLKSNILLRLLFGCNVSDYKKEDKNIMGQRLERF